jgi:small acid-soluble spore protein H (minor)
METDRAQQIMEAHEKIGVVHNGVYVWIDSVDSNKGTAKVHVEDNPRDAKIVPVEQLMEVQ